MDNKMKSTFGGVVLGVVMLLVAFNVSGITVDQSAFGLYEDLTGEEASQTGINYTSEGYLALGDTDTTGTWTSVEYDVGNETRLDAYVSELNANNSVSVTVTGYDSGGTSVGTATATLEDGQNSLDLTTIGSGVESVDVQFDLDRDTTSITSPEVTGYEGYEEGTVPYLNYLVAVFGIAVLLFSLRDL